MYQKLVLGLGSLLLIGLGYFITHTDSNGALKASLSARDVVTASSSAEILSGEYVCDTDSGCKNPRVLTISPEGGATIETSYANGAELLDELGTWRMGNGGKVFIILTGTTHDTYPAPRVLTARYSSKTSLSGITFDATQYPDLDNPVFRKQIDQAE
jgi:hypothetical protein